MTASSMICTVQELAPNSEAVTTAEEPQTATADASTRGFWLADYLNQQATPSISLLRSVVREYYASAVLRSTLYGVLLRHLTQVTERRRVLRVLCLEAGLASSMDRAALSRSEVENSPQSMPSLFRKMLAALGGNPTRCISWVPSATISRFERYLNEAPSAEVIGAVLLGWEASASQLNQALLAAFERCTAAARNKPSYLQIRTALDREHEQELRKHARVMAADAARGPALVRGQRIGQQAFESLFTCFANLQG